jgi:hypothetical protein
MSRIRSVTETPRPRQRGVAARLGDTDRTNCLTGFVRATPEMTYEEGRQAAQSLGEHLNGLAKLGLIVAVRYLYLLKTGGVGEPQATAGALELRARPESEPRCELIRPL